MPVYSYIESHIFKAPAELPVFLMKYQVDTEFLLIFYSCCNIYNYSRYHLGKPTLRPLRLRGEQKKVLPAMFPSPKAPSCLDYNSSCFNHVNLFGVLGRT
jgi:hypothetical protein